MRRWLSSARGAVRPFVLVSGGVAASIVAVAIALGGGGTPPTDGVANLWVNSTAGASPSRCSTPCAYNAANAYGSFAAAAAAAASSGDVIRVRGVTFGRQGSIGASGKTLTYIGETGATISSGVGGCPAYDTLSLNGGVTMEGVNVTGDCPIVQVYGSGNQWRGTAARHSRLDMSPGAIRPCNGDEPLLIQDGDAPTGVYTIDGNTIGPYLTIGPFRGYNGGVISGCPDGYLHLEQTRLGRGARNITFDRVTWEACPGGSGYVGCGSGNLFFTNCCGGTGSPPTGIVVKNSRFLGADPFSMQAGAQMTHNANWTFAYNYFANSPIADDGAITGITWIGNAGPRQQFCTTGYTFTRNVWQHAVGTPCGTDTLIIGPSFETSALGVNTAGVTQPGSPLINAGQATSCPAASNQDFDGTARPIGAACDAGTKELG